MSKSEVPPAAIPPDVFLAAEQPATPGAGTTPWFFHFEDLRVQAVAAVALKAGAAASALLLQWLIARMYGAEGNGLFALMATTVTFIGVMAVAGQDYIALRNVTGDLADDRPDSARANASASVRIAIISGLLATLATLAVAAAHGLGDTPAMFPILVLAAPVVLGLSLGRVFAFVARAGGRVLTSQLPDGPITAVCAVFFLGAAALTWGVPPTWTLGAIYGAAYCVALGYAVYLYKTVVSQWPAGGSKPPLRPIVLAGLPLVLANASPYFSDWLIIFSATAFYSADVAGQIRIVTLFLSVMYMIFIAFDAVFAPQIASALRLKDMSRLRRVYWQYALGAFAMNLPLVLAVLVAPGLILGVFGPEFVSASSALRVAVAIQAVSILLGPAGTVLVMAHRENQVIWVNVAGLVVLLAGCWFLIPAYGVFGGALVSALVLLGKRVTEIALMGTVFLRPNSRETG